MTKPAAAIAPMLLRPQRQPLAKARPDARAVESLLQARLALAGSTQALEHRADRHLEVAFMHDAVARTEAKIREAGRLLPAA